MPSPDADPDGRPPGSQLHQPNQVQRSISVLHLPRAGDITPGLRLAISFRTDPATPPPQHQPQPSRLGGFRKTQSERQAVRAAAAAHHPPASGHRQAPPGPPTHHPRHAPRSHVDAPRPPHLAPPHKPSDRIVVYAPSSAPDAATHTAPTNARRGTPNGSTLQQPHGTPARSHGFATPSHPRGRRPARKSCPHPRCNDDKHYRDECPNNRGRKRRRIHDARPEANLPQPPASHGAPTRVVTYTPPSPASTAGRTTVPSQQEAHRDRLLRPPQATRSHGLSSHAGSPPQNCWTCGADGHQAANCPSDSPRHTARPGHRAASTAGQPRKPAGPQRRSPPQTPRATTDHITTDPTTTTAAPAAAPRKPSHLKPPFNPSGYRLNPVSDDDDDIIADAEPDAVALPPPPPPPTEQAPPQLQLSIPLPAFPPFHGAKENQCAVCRAQLDRRSTRYCVRCDEEQRGHTHAYCSARCESSDSARHRQDYHWFVRPRPVDATFATLTDDGTVLPRSQQQRAGRIANLRLPNLIGPDCSTRYSPMPVCGMTLARTTPPPDGTRQPTYLRCAGAAALSIQQPSAIDEAPYHLRRIEANFWAGYSEDLFDFSATAISNLARLSIDCYIHATFLLVPWVHHYRVRVCYFRRESALYTDLIGPLASVGREYAVTLQSAFASAGWPPVLADIVFNYVGLPIHTSPADRDEERRHPRPIRDDGWGPHIVASAAYGTLASLGDANDGGRPPINSRLIFIDTAALDVPWELHGIVPEEYRLATTAWPVQPAAATAPAAPPPEETNHAAPPTPPTAAIAPTAPPPAAANRAAPPTSGTHHTLWVSPPQSYEGAFGTADY